MGIRFELPVQLTLSNKQRKWKEKLKKDQIF